MRNPLPLLLAALAACLAAAGPLVAQETTARVVTRDGVTLPTSRRVDGHEMVLNGTALRKKAIFKVYVAGLYLPRRSSDAEAILAADEPRQVVMRFVRDVDAEPICEAWQDGLEANTPDPSAELRRQFDTLCGWMEDVDDGDLMTFTYLPGTGTTVEVKGGTKGTIEGKAFADALFKAWIGPKPGPGEDFKRDLLGRT